MWASRLFARSPAAVGLIIRFLFIGSRLCSTLLSDPASRRRPCASLSLHLQAVDHARRTKKAAPLLGPQFKRGNGKESQERRCKGPIRQPDRLNVRSRERRVKVKRGLFSYFGEEHLPGQNDDAKIGSALPLQVVAEMTFIGVLEIQRGAHPPSYPGQKHAESCTLTAGHYFAPRKDEIRPLPTDGCNQPRVAATSCPRPFAACPAGSDTAARAR